MLDIRLLGTPPLVTGQHDDQVVEPVKPDGAAPACVLVHAVDQEGQRPLEGIPLGLLQELLGLVGGDGVAPPLHLHVELGQAFDAQVGIARSAAVLGVAAYGTLKGGRQGFGRLELARLALGSAVHWAAPRGQT